MIVTCERCATQFQLDDARVPAGGVRVRCSRCKHAFEIRLPEPGAPPAAAGESEEEESDWEFNEDPPSSEAEADAAGIGHQTAANVVDELLGSAESSAPQRSEPEESPPQQPEPAAPAPPSSLDLADESPFEAPKPDLVPDDRRGAARDEDVALDELETDPDDGSDLELEVDDLPTPELAAAAGDPGDELSSRGDWDLLAGENGGAETDFGVVPSRPTLDVDPHELIDDRPAWQIWLSRSVNTIGGGFVAVLFGLGVYGGLRAAPVPQAPAIAVAEGFELADVSGTWIDHLELGPVYVVRGRLHNTQARAAAPPGLAVELRDDRGHALQGPAALALPRSDRELREAPLEELEAPSPRSGLPLRPGEQRPFEAVLGPLVPGAHRLAWVESAAPAAWAARRAPTPAPQAASGTSGDPPAQTPAGSAGEPPESAPVAPPAARAP